MIKEYLKLFRNNLVKFSIFFFVKFNLPYFVALILYFQSEKSKSTDKYQILYLSKPVFNDDVSAIREKSKKLLFKKFPRLSLSVICKFFLPDFNSYNDANYHVMVKDSLNVDMLRTFLNKVIIFYRRFNHFDAVLAGNFVYTQQQELFLVLKNLKIPSIIIYKEGMLPISKFKSAKDFLYKTKVFRADHIMFYNNFIRDTLVDVGMPGLNLSKTSVVGLPRFDSYFKNEFFKKTSKQIVLFSFEPYEKGSYLVDDKKQFKSFEKEVLKFHLLFAKFCEINKEYKLVVKTKGSQRAIDYASKIFSDYRKIIGDRLIISSSILANDLITSSSHIAGFSSTTLIEGLALNKKIICPKFSPSVIKKENDLLHPYQKLASYVLTYPDLLTAFSKGNIRNKTLKKKFIRERVYKDDGKSSLRAEQCIINVIKNYKN